MFATNILQHSFFSWRTIAAKSDYPVSPFLLTCFVCPTFVFQPNNPDLVARFNIIKEKRSRGEPTVPSMMGDEKKTNPFLRCDISEEIRKNVGVTDGDSEADAFGKLRKAKDNF